MNHAEIAHRWAAQYNGLYTLPKDMTLSGGNIRSNVSFSGPAFYSYGTVIARFREHKGKVYLLVNDTSYSISTCKHKCHMRRAIRHMPDELEFVIGNQPIGARLENPPKELYQYAIEMAASCHDQATRARANKSYLLQRSEEWLRDAQRISDFFGLKKKADDKAIEKLAKEKARAEKQYAKEKERIEKERERQKAEDIKKAEAKLVEWLAGDYVANLHLLNLLPVRLRVSGSFEVGAIHTIQTSHGATIPYADGLLCYRFCSRLWRNGERWHRNGHQFKVGPYYLDEVYMDGIVAGCHVISREEIERFAQQEGWSAPTPPSPSTEETNEDTQKNEVVG